MDIPKQLVDAFCEKYSRSVHQKDFRELFDRWEVTPKDIREITFHLAATMLIDTLALIGIQSKEEYELRQNSIKLQAYGLNLMTFGKE